MSSAPDIAEVPALQPLLRDWPTAALSRLERVPCLVRVIVASVRGSAPREPGACMLVDSQGVIGTIGGGNLEHEAIVVARALISELGDAELGDAEPDDAGLGDTELGDAESGDAEPNDVEWGDVAPSRAAPIRVRRMTLGRDLAQCCGGVVELWFERLAGEDRVWLAAAASAARAGRAVLITRATHALPDRTCLTSDVEEGLERVRLETNAHGMPTLRERIDAPATPLWLYGAGHVGRAVVRALAELPFDVTWIDSREALLRECVPSNTRTLHTGNPAGVTSRAPASAYHLVMTHDHGLDFEVCRAILTHGQFAWLGLIGSASKAAKFRARLARAGVASERIARLVCPIGIGGLTSKLPAAIAASVTVQLLQELEHSAERVLFRPEPEVGAAISAARPPAPLAAGRAALPGARPAALPAAGRAVLPAALPATFAAALPTALPGALPAARRLRASLPSPVHTDCEANNCESCHAHQVTR